MRRFILVAALAGWTPVSFAFAQQWQNSPTPANPTPPVPAAPMAASPMVASPMAAPEPNNCGTPDEPKSCSPMPSHALKHYPAMKHSTG